jgi:opacity protein-like surface antigen
MRIRILSKKIVTICAILVFSLLFFSRFALSEERENFKSKLSFIISGGLRHMSVGDINTHLESFDDYLSNMTNYEGGMITKLDNYNSELEKTPEFELRLDISSKLAISAGIGFISQKNEGNFEFIDPFPFSGQAYTHIISTEPKASAVLLKLGSYYKIPIISGINLFLSGGINYYFSKVSLYKSHEFGRGLFLGSQIKEENYEVSSNNFGLYGGMGFEFRITEHITFVLGFRGRYARIKNLKGNRFIRVYRGWIWPEEKSEEGILYIGEKDMTDEWHGGYTPDLIISPSKPSGNEFRNIREAVLDFSGYSLRLGIRIKLF